MAWEQLLDIAREAAAEREAERGTPPSACPNDGEPLQEDPQGRLRCRFDGYVWTG
jgi:hypothetical protein